MAKLLTLSIVHDETRILLGMKKRGFGAGKWNGFGGKVAEEESVEDAARRELYEEAGLTATHLEKRAVLKFTIETEPELLEVHVFSVFGFEGEPAETEEMRPQWFSKTHIPYHAMWADDIHWLPLFLEGKCFTGSFHFLDNDTLISHTLKLVTEA